MWDLADWPGWECISSDITYANWYALMIIIIIIGIIILINQGFILRVGSIGISHSWRSILPRYIYNNNLLSVTDYNSYLIRGLF